MENEKKICPFQNGNQCQEAACPLWKYNRCRVPDVVDAVEQLDDVSAALTGIASDLADIRGQLCPTPVPSSWEHFGGGRHKTT